MIVLNLPEPPASALTAQTRVNHDLALLRECFSKIFIEGDEKVAAAIRVKSAFRLGRRSKGDEETVKMRPIKVVLGSVEEAEGIFRRAHRLRGVPIRIHRDLEVDDRIKLRDALCELRTRREAGEQDLYIQDFRVVRKRPRIRWTPLTQMRGIAAHPVPNRV